MRPSWRSLRALPLLAWGLLLPGALGAQAVTERTPNLVDGWVGGTGTVHFNFLHRFWLAGDKLVNSPTFLLAGPVSDGILVGGQYASNAIVAFNEWELFARWAPREAARDGPWGLGLTAAYNPAAGSVDGDASVTVDAGRFRFLGSLRAFSDVLGEGEAAWGGGGGVVVRLREGLALSADLLAMSSSAVDRTAWGAGLQWRIPTTPHTLSLQATNTRTGTLQGSAAGRSRTLWGFEFTIPVTLARFFPGMTAAHEPREREAPEEGVVEVTMTDRLRFAPETVRVQVGQTVRWINTTPIIHTVTADPAQAMDPSRVALPEGAEPFDSGDMREGEAFAHTFTVPGEYLYICVPHEAAAMVGRVEVLPRSSSPGGGGG